MAKKEQWKLPFDSGISDTHTLAAREIAVRGVYIARFIDVIT